MLHAGRVRVRAELRSKRRRLCPESRGTEAAAAARSHRAGVFIGPSRSSERHRSYLLRVGEAARTWCIGATAGLVGSAVVWRGVMFEGVSLAGWHVAMRAGLF